MEKRHRYHIAAVEGEKNETEKLQFGTGCAQAD
jgi:hypothetical protein